jgi:antitoxin component of RelBE/YafQ-DinJ toxin-antitoxin module
MASPRQLFCLISIMSCMGGCSGSDDAVSKVKIQEEIDRHAAINARVDAISKEASALRVDVANLTGELLALRETVGRQTIESRMAADGFQRDIVRLQSEIDGLHAERTMVNAILDRVPLDARLKLKTDLHVAGSLEEVLTRIARQSGIPIRVLANDLKEEMIPAIRQLDLHYVNMTFEQILADVMLKGNLYPTEASTVSDPKLKLVYVVTNADAGGRQEILVTTRKRAGERGLLPAAFQVRQ